MKYLNIAAKEIQLYDIVILDRAGWGDGRQVVYLKRAYVGNYSYSIERDINNGGVVVLRFSQEQRYLILLADDRFNVLRDVSEQS